MREWVLSIDSPPVPYQMAEKIALVLALHGFKVPGHLRGLQPDDLVELFEAKLTLAVLRRGMEKLDDSHMEGKLALGSQASSNQATLVKSSAEALASILAPEQYKQAETSIAVLEEDFGVSGLSTSLRPFEAIEKLGLAKAAGKDVDLLLSAKAENFRDLSVQGSYASVASALRCWHRFATLFLGYSEDSTLPPREAEHVVKFLAVFRKAKTAENYIGAIKWACIRTKLPITWRDATVAQGLAGAKRRTITMIGEAAQQRFFLTHVIMVQLIQMLLRMEVPPGMAVLAVIAWQFLLRVQSEGIPLVRGSPAACHGLPPACHSGVWIAADKIHIRLRKRKHRASGSWLKRACTCSECPLLCGIHFAGQYVMTKPIGEELFGFSQAQFTHAIKRALTLLEIPGASTFSLKAFRAGRATELALKGVPIGKILQAGEWKSSAFLRYIDEDTVDHASFAHEILESDDE
jgi:hypothetical protein